MRKIRKIIRRLWRSWIVYNEYENRKNERQAHYGPGGTIVYGGIQMRELKTYYCTTIHNEHTEFYSKFEADKVIADLEESHKMEVEQLLIEIAEKDKEIAELEERIADGDKDFEMANHQNERLLKIVRHANYKRCLEMAKICENKLGTIVKPGWWDKWRKRWLELAEKFKDKEAK